MFTVLSHDRKYDAVMCFTVVCHQPDQLMLFACIVRQLPFHSLIINRCVTTVSLSPDSLASDVETCAELDSSKPVQDGQLCSQDIQICHLSD